MRRIKIILLAILGIFLLFPIMGYASEIVPNNDFYVYDDVGILSNENKQEIISKNKEYENTKEKPQIVVVITNKNIDVDSEAPKIFEEFKIGNNEFDNGILILYSETEKKIRIEVGYGLEGVIPDATAGDILDHNVDDLKSNNKKDVEKGLMETFRAVSSLIDSEYEFDFSTYDKPDYVKDEKFSRTIRILIIVAIISWIILFYINPELALDILNIVLSILSSSTSSSSSKSSRGGGGRSGGGGASR